MRRRLLLCLALAMATTIVFGRTRSFEFVNYDDPLYLMDSPEVCAGLGVDGVTWAFTSGHASNWHPLTTLSHMVDCAIFGLEPAGHHLANVALHTANVVLLFLVLEAATGATWPSLVVAALFALHPLHVQPVAWVSSRKDVLSTFFGFLATAAWVGWTRRGGAGRYALVAVLFALGLMAKPMLVTLPAAFVLLDVWPLGRLRGGIAGVPRLVLEKVPLLLLSAASSIATVGAQTVSGAVMPVEYISVPHRLVTGVVSYARYLDLTVWPRTLAALYQHPYLPGGRPPETWEIAGAVAVLLGISIFVLWCRRPYAIVGWLWFVGMLFPVSGLFQVGAQPMADRFTYLPHVGLFVALVWGAAELASRGGPWLERALATGTALILVTLGAASWAASETWRDSLSLWAQTLRAAPHSPIVHYNLGHALFSRGRLSEATEHYREAVDVSPNYVVALGGLGVALQMQGHRVEAMALYERALSLQPDYVPARNSLGIALQEEGRLEEAAREYREVLRLAPGHAKAHNNLGYTLELLRQPAEAEQEYREALRLTPAYPAALSNLARFLDAQGRYDEAARTYRRLLALDPGSAGTLNNLGMLLRKQGDLDAAAEQLERALRLKPDYPIALNNLGIVYQTQGRIADAIVQYRRAIELAPGYASAHANLGHALAGDGRRDEAVVHFRRALDLHPDLPSARVGLTRALAQ